ncbi:hypothetical protein ACFYXQ_17405 [Nocardia jiangxiensis]|uniref:Uncharacterized protein n=1 Tax=Nocardia jiangxiensis TaxID=282685 RepID=A0ABW6S1I0_9NOCA
MGDEAHIPNSYQLRDDFKPKSENADKNTVLGTDSSVGTEISQVAWETYGKDLDTLVKYRDSIKSGSVRDMAKNWRGHGSSLNTLANKFSNEVKSKIIDSWDSNGGSTASTAVQRYADQLAQLPIVINAIAHSLDFSAEFLDITRNNIPDDKGMLVDGKTSVVTNSGTYDTAESRAQLKSLLTQRANDVMNEVFVPGGKSVDAVMPVFPLPQPVTTGLPDPTGNRTGTPGPGPSVSTPGPGPAGPSMPSLTPTSYAKQLEQQQKEQEQNRTNSNSNNRGSSNRRRLSRSNRCCSRGCKRECRLLSRSDSSSRRSRRRPTPRASPAAWRPLPWRGLPPRR